MTITLRLTDELHEALKMMAVGDVESAAVLLAKPVALSPDRTLLLGTEVIPVPDDAYEVRTDMSLQVTSDGYVHALKAARQRGMMAIWVHSHPGDGAIPLPSRHDRVVNDQLADLFADQTDTGLYGYLVVAHRGNSLTFSGALAGRIEGRILELSAIGSRWTFRAAHDTDEASDSDLFDRSIRAFGNQIQETIGRLTVGIVGCGGTGSATAEQLARLGVRSFILIDPDSLSASNTTRVYGSSPADVGRAKVDVLGDHLERIADGVHTVRLHGSIITEAVARALRGADVIFGCTDDNAGRLRLSRMPYFYLTPVIDCGVQIPATDGIIAGIFARVTTLHPGAACLICRDRVDLAIAEAETRSEAEQQRLEKEGYAPALPGIEPAVVSFTTLVAATAVSELLERLVGYGETPPPTELILYIHDRTVRGNIESPRAHHYCEPDTRSAGADDDDMFLGLNWIS